MGGTREYFEDLGRTAAEWWTAAGRRNDDLPEVAARALGEIPIPSELGARTVLERLARDDELPQQRSSTSQTGQPATVMYASGGLEVQVLTWIEGSTSIHQHAFDGAFRVLTGSSLHVTYRFDAAEELAGGHLRTGRLEMRETEVLRPGATRPIPAGSGFIHSLFHLERPSVTIMVRNKVSGPAFPQFSYRSPGLGYDTGDKDDRFSMRLRGLRALRSLDPDEALRVARDIMREDDLWAAFKVAEDWFETGDDVDDLHALLSSLGLRDRAFSDLLEDAYTEERRKHRLMMRRGMLVEQRHRLLLAVLVNAPDVRSIRAALRELFPDRRPEAITLEIIEELASPGYRGVSGLKLQPDELDRLRGELAAGRLAEGLALLGAQWLPRGTDALAGM
jgi:hypothetical protein